MSVARPAWFTEKSVVPVEEATLSGLTPGAACTLNEYEDEVALIPATSPLSRRVALPKVFEFIQRGTYPTSPPERVPDGVPKYITPEPSVKSD